MSIKSCLVPIRNTPIRMPFGVVFKEADSLPLKGIHCQARLDGPVAVVTIIQLYVHEGTEPVNVRYTFPLPADAALFACEMWVGERKLVAKVKPEEQARQEFAENVKQGRHAVLVEAVRQNLFAMDLGNLQPGETVEIKLSYLDVLDQSVMEQTDRVSRLRVPFCPGIPYIPGKPLFRSSKGLGVPDTDQVPDASRITPPRISAHDSRAAALSIEVIAPYGGTVSSPTHRLASAEITGVAGESDRRQFGLDHEQAVPDQDFILEWRHSGKEQISVLRKDAFALLTVAGPVQSIRSAQLAQDVYFLVDRSGSMEGIKWDKTLEALKRFVAILGDQDRVDICFFESQFLHFSDDLEPRNTILSDPKFRAIEKHMGTAGGTELLPALNDVLKWIQKAKKAARSSVIILITDGQVGNSQPILEVLKPHPEIVLHTFGIDTAVNDSLLKELARQQHGWCVLKTPNEDIAGAVQTLAERVASPAFTELKTLGAWKSAAPLPPIYCGDVLCAALHLEGAAGDSELRLSGRDRNGEVHEWTLPFHANTTPKVALDLLWAKEQIDEHLRNNRKDEAVKLACQHNISCPGAAWVAWDEVAQKVADAMVNQPSLAPAQWDMCAPAPCAPASQPRYRTSSIMAKPVGAISNLPVSPSISLAPKPIVIVLPAPAPQPISPPSAPGSGGGGGIVSDMADMIGGVVGAAANLVKPKSPVPSGAKSQSMVLEERRNADGVGSSMDLDLLTWEGSVRRLVLFQTPENLPLLEKLLKWAAAVEHSLRTELLDKLAKLKTADAQRGEIEKVLAK